MAPELQKNALEGLLQGLSVDALALPTKVTDALVPKSGNYGATRESFDSATGVVIDPIGMAEVLSRHTCGQLLQPMRLNRVNQGYFADKEQLSVVTLVNKLLAKTVFADAPNGPSQGVWMRVNAVVLDALLASYHDGASSQIGRAHV